MSSLSSWAKAGKGTQQLLQNPQVRVRHYFNRLFVFRHGIAFANRRRGKNHTILQNKVSYETTLKNHSRGLKLYLVTTTCHLAWDSAFVVPGMGVILALDTCMLWAEPDHRQSVIQIRVVDGMKNTWCQTVQTTTSFVISAIPITLIHTFFAPKSTTTRAIM